MLERKVFVSSSLQLKPRCTTSATYRFAAIGIPIVVASIRSLPIRVLLLPAMVSVRHDCEEGMLLMMLTPGEIRPKLKAREEVE
jgi:hypothetical protein